MSGKIIPRMFNGTKRLIFSETVCVLPTDCFEIHIPITMQNSAAPQDEISIRFDFEFSKGKEPIIKEFVASGKQLKITLLNFNNPLGTGTTKGIDFNISGKPYYLLFYANGLLGKDRATQIVKMTVSMYSNEGVLTA